MAIETYSASDFILRLAPIRSTCVAAGIAVDSGFESFAVYVVYKGTQSVGETVWVNEKVAVGVASAEETVVYIDVVVSALHES
jgi:hypothetical protein